MADYEPGRMEIEDQKEMYDAFWAWSIRTGVFVAIVLVLMYVFLA